GVGGWRDWRPLDSGWRGAECDPGTLGGHNYGYYGFGVAVTVRASIELSNGHRIQSDFPELRVTTEGDWPGTGSATAEGSLNGGGPLLKVRTTAGDIRILRAP